MLVSEYTLRQTTPEQVTTHWSTCYAHHSACMQRKVEEMTREIQAAEKLGAYTALKLTQQVEENVRLTEEIVALREALRLMYYGSDTVSQREIQEQARALLATREGKG